MKSILKYIACAMLCCTAPSLHAQYIMVMNDNTRIHLADNPLTFAGSGEQGTTLSVDGVDYNLQDIASIEYAGPVTTPIALAYHPYYSSRLPLAEMVTHIDYGFAEVYVRDGEYQGFKLQGSESAFRRIVQLKQEHPGVKICLSFTHTVVNSDNHQDGGFSAIAASDEYRRQFAQDCLDFLVKWGIDGVDLDWEFPGLSWSGAACDPVNDVANYTLLVKQLRETLGPCYLVTFAGYCMNKKTTSSGTRYIDLPAVEPYVDFVNVMCYDFDEAPHFHNAIKSSISYWDIERTVTAYRNCHFPMDKVVLGLPFYVRNTFGGTTTPYSRIGTLGTKPDFVVDNWDDNARVPYVTYKGNMWGSYENPQSIAGKGIYAAEKGMRDLFYWCTYEDDDNHTLARAVWQAVLDNWQ